MLQAKVNWRLRHIQDSQSELGFPIIDDYGAIQYSICTFLNIYRYKVTHYKVILVLTNGFITTRIQIFGYYVPISTNSHYYRFPLLQIPITTNSHYYRFPLLQIPITIDSHYFQIPIFTILYLRYKLFIIKCYPIVSGVTE